MKNDSTPELKGKKKHPTVLLIVTTIFAILYAALIIGYLIFESIGSEVTLEGIIVDFAFIVFLIGYYYSWMNELIAGIIFIFWWIIMWYLALFVSETDKGVGVAMGIPVIIFGILFIVYWYRKRLRVKGS